MGADLRAVAARAGVSLSTASRALADSRRISSATRARVHDAAAALGYRPNATARALRTRRSQLAGLVVTSLSNASLTTIAEVVQRQLAQAGLQMVLSVSHGDAAQERAAIDTLIDLSAAGVIVVGADVAATSALSSSGIAVVHLARHPVDPAGDSVLVDDQAGALAATRHLLVHGHRRIGVIAGPHQVTSGRERLGGYLDALAGAGIDVDDDLVQAGPFTAAFGEQALTRLLTLPSSRRPTALLVSNHEAAWGVLPALRARALAVPGDLSVVCYEDADLLRWWQPAVSAVDIDATSMGDLAARALLARIADPRTPIRELRVSPRLVERASCAAPDCPAQTTDVTRLQPEVLDPPS